MILLRAAYEQVDVYAGSDQKRLRFSFRTRLAQGFAQRLKGLMGSTSPDADALLFERCRSVHTFGMAFPIDIAFLSGDTVIGSERCCLPSRVFGNTKADTVIERPASDAPWLEVGDRIIRT